MDKSLKNSLNKFGWDPAEGSSGDGLRESLQA